MADAVKAPVPAPIVATTEGRPKFVFSGYPGGAFNVDGEGFGEDVGTVIVSDRSLKVTRWNDHIIKGELPVDVKHGPVEIKSIAGKVLFTGTYGKAKV